MRKQPYSVGSVVHVINRGARGMPIVRQDSDKWRFLKLLYFLNDYNKPSHWERDIEKLRKGLHFERPKDWLERDPAVNILSYCLMPNHFHLLLEEIKKGGISSFMQSLGGSMTVYFNNKYKEKGSLFQGSFRSKTIDSDKYLNLVNVYINVKNPFELYAGGLVNAVRDFDRAYGWASGYPFCSLGDIAKKRIDSPILNISETYRYNPDDYKDMSAHFLKEKLVLLQEADFLE